MHPVLFQIELFGRTISAYSYGTMLMLAFICGWLLALPRLKRLAYKADKVLTVIFGSSISALIAARLLFVLTNWQAFAPTFPESLLNFRSLAGMVAYGGYLGGFLGSFLLARWYGWNWLALADTVAPSLALGLCLTRIGCFLAGCGFGLPTEGPFGVSFPRWSHTFHDHLLQGLISHNALLSLPVHPTQLYESLAGLVICVILLVIFRKFQRHIGVTFASFLMLYGVFRFLVEFIRGDLGRGIYAGLSTSQWLAVFTVGWAIWIVRRSLLCR